MLGGVEKSLILHRRNSFYLLLLIFGSVFCYNGHSYSAALLSSSPFFSLLQLQQSIRDRGPDKAGSNSRGAGGGGGGGRQVRNPSQLCYTYRTYNTQRWGEEEEVSRVEWGTGKSREGGGELCKSFSIRNPHTRILFQNRFFCKAHSMASKNVHSPLTAYLTLLLYCRRLDYGKKSMAAISE